MKISSVVCRLLLAGMSFLSIGAVAKKQDPITLTQTDPVAFKEKQKEEAEGKKGPPSPTLEFFPRQRFLSEAPVASSKQPEKTVHREEAKESSWSEDELWESEGGKKPKRDKEFKPSLETDDTWQDAEEDEGGLS